MVVLHVKSPDAEEETEFLYECAASTAVGDVAAALGALAGLQTRLLSLCRRLRGEILTKTASSLWARGSNRTDAALLVLRSAARCADAGAAAVGELERALDEAEAYASKEQVQHNRFLSPRALREHIKNIEKKCATALQEPPEALDLQKSSSDNKHERIQLWWAGKELAMDHKLCDYIGINDKSKIVVKLTRARDDH